MAGESALDELLLFLEAVGVARLQIAHDRVGIAGLEERLEDLGAVREEDAVAEGWVVRRGRSTVFCEAAVRSSTGDAVATGTLVYTVRVPTSG